MFYYIVLPAMFVAVFFNGVWRLFKQTLDETRDDIARHKRTK